MFILASTGFSLGKIFDPIYRLLAYIVAFFYSLIPDYVFAIAMLTIAVMVVLTPLSVKSIRGMMAMQKLQPEMQKIRQKYKDDKQRLQEEMMRVYRENNVPMTGGCLPMLLQLPVLFILYGLIEGLTHRTPGPHSKPDPLYISHTSLLYHNLIANNGKISDFGVNLAKSALNHHASFSHAIIFWLIVAISVAFGYLQMAQMNRRNSSAMQQLNPQMQSMNKFMPIMFGILYVFLGAILNVYFIVSSVYRIGLQELTFRYHPDLRGESSTGAGRSAVDTTAREREVPPPGSRPSSSKHPTSNPPRSGARPTSGPKRLGQGHETRNANSRGTQEGGMRRESKRRPDSPGKPLVDGKRKHGGEQGGAAREGVGQGNASRPSPGTTSNGKKQAGELSGESQKGESAERRKKTQG
jgi:YidC/Oxa1 family membrane protein insertase